MSDDQAMPVRQDTAAPIDEFQAAVQELKQRCSKAGIPVEESKFSDNSPYLRVKMPSGRDSRIIPLWNASSIHELLKVSFERFRFLGKYLAICSYEDGTIESGIHSYTPDGLRRLKQRVSRSDSKNDEDDEAAINLIANHSSTSIRVMITPPSQAFNQLSRSRSGLTRHGTLKIEGLQISEHDQALQLLERLANTFFFQIDLSQDLALGLLPDRREQRRVLRGRRNAEPVEVEFPRNEYDGAPMALYWYARAAIGMPLLQYLAYYQAIEYYFPTYSQADARRRIRGIIKNPTFRADRDGDIGRILALVKGAGSGLGDERSQLRATILECLDPASIRKFLTDEDEKNTFFSKKVESLTDKKLAIRSVDDDIRNDVADRIYDIRCKIVHTKGKSGDGEVELLLPFSPQAELLSHDIDLIQLVARQVLIAASSPLRL